ncbi:MAG: hypothetical protein ACI8P0_005799, partial [Planctomycetaceae bacterium]
MADPVEEQGDSIAEHAVSEAAATSVLPIEVPGWQRLAGRHDHCNLKSHRQLHLFHTIGTKV